MSEEEKKSTAPAPEAQETPEAKKPVATAAKPAKAAAPPDPRAVTATALADSIKASIETHCCADAVEETGAAKTIPLLRIAAHKWREVVLFLRDFEDHQYDYVELMAGTDYKDYIEVVVYLYSMKRRTYITVKTRTPRNAASLPSLASVFPGVNWEEREIYDLLGVHFEGHPDLRRIMMWDEWKGHPLRKDYSDFDNIPTRGGEPR